MGEPINYRFDLFPPAQRLQQGEPLSKVALAQLNGREICLMRQSSFDELFREKLNKNKPLLIAEIEDMNKRKSYYEGKLIYPWIKNHFTSPATTCAIARLRLFETKNIREDNVVVCEQKGVCEQQSDLEGAYGRQTLTGILRAAVRFIRLQCAQGNLVQAKSSLMDAYSLAMLVDDTQLHFDWAVMNELGEAFLDFRENISFNGQEHPAHHYAINLFASVLSHTTFHPLQGSLLDYYPERSSPHAYAFGRVTELVFIYGQNNKLAPVAQNFIRFLRSFRPCWIFGVQLAYDLLSRLEERGIIKSSLPARIELLKETLAYDQVHPFALERLVTILDGNNQGDAGEDIPEAIHYLKLALNAQPLHPFALKKLISILRHDMCEHDVVQANAMLQNAIETIALRKQQLEETNDPDREELAQQMDQLVEALDRL